MRYNNVKMTLYRLTRVIILDSIVVVNVVHAMLSECPTFVLTFNGIKEIISICVVCVC